jgi:hypothetical protein
MTKSNKREYWFVPVLFAVFLLMPMAAVAQGSNTQSVQDPDILHDVALSFVASSDALSADLERAWRMHAKVLEMRTRDDPRYPACAKTQGHLAYQMGKLKEAQEAFEAAGLGAILRIEVHDALTSFKYAALVAASRGRSHDAQRLSQWAADLVELQVLDAEERRNLRIRLLDFSAS